MQQLRIIDGINTLQLHNPYLPALKGILCQQNGVERGSEWISLCQKL